MCGEENLVVVSCFQNHVKNCLVEFVLDQKVCVKESLEHLQRDMIETTSLKYTSPPQLGGILALLPETLAVLTLTIKMDKVFLSLIQSKTCYTANHSILRGCGIWIHPSIQNVVHNLFTQHI